MPGDRKAFASRHKALLVAVQAHHVLAPVPLDCIEVLPVTPCHSKQKLGSDLPTNPQVALPGLPCTMSDLNRGNKSKNAKSICCICGDNVRTSLGQKQVFWTG